MEMTLRTNGHHDYVVIPDHAALELRSMIRARWVEIPGVGFGSAEIPLADAPAWLRDVERLIASVRSNVRHPGICGESHWVTRGTDRPEMSTHVTGQWCFARHNSGRAFVFQG